MANQLVTIEQLRKRSGLALADETDELAAAEVILDGLVDALEGHAGRPLTVTDVTGERHVNHAGGNLYLRVTPVVSVTEVRTTVFSGTSTVVPADSYEVTLWGITPAPHGTIEVDYTAGKDAPPAAIHVVLEAASRVVWRMDGDEDGLKSIAQEGYRVEFITEAFTESELALIPKRRKSR